MVSIGVHYSPDEFVAEAAKIGHPTRMLPFSLEEISEVVSSCLGKDPKVVVVERTEETRRWISLMGDLKADELAWKSELSDRRWEVLKDKKRMLFKRLHEDAKHEDTTLVEQLSSGFDLTGMLPESSVFNRKLRPATMSCEEFRKVSDLGRDGILQSVASSGDPELDELLYAATMKEVSKGFLVQGISETEILPGATLTRRFGIKQKTKIRPIDDYKSSFVNSSVTQSETATVHTVDHIAAWYLVCSGLPKPTERRYNSCPRRGTLLMRTNKCHSVMLRLSWIHIWWCTAIAPKGQSCSSRKYFHSDQWRPSRPFSGCPKQFGSWAQFYVVVVF